MDNPLGLFIRYFYAQFTRSQFKLLSRSKVGNNMYTSELNKIKYIWSQTNIFCVVMVVLKMPKLLNRVFSTNSGKKKKKKNRPATAILTYIIKHWTCLALYRPSLEKGSDQLIVTLYVLSIYHYVQNLVIRTLFEAQPVFNQISFQKVSFC